MQYLLKKINPEKLVFGVPFTIFCLFSITLFGTILLYKKVVQPDLILHFQFSETLFSGNRIPAHPLFFFLIRLLSFFSNSDHLKLFAAFTIFAWAQFEKVRGPYLYWNNSLHVSNSIFSIISILLLQLVISIPFEKDVFIKNQISPNYFHNGTLLLSIPFSFFLLKKSFDFIKYEEKTTSGMVILGILILLIKPSFLFCYVPLFPLFTFYKFNISKKLYDSLRVSLILTFCLIIQSIYLKFFPPTYLKQIKIEVIPFFFFGSIVQHLKMFFGGSYLIWLGLLLFPKILSDKNFIFLITMLLWGYLMSVIFVVSAVYPGSNQWVYFPDFSWQTSMLLYFCLVYLVGWVLGSHQKKWKLYLYFLAIFLNAVWGSYYILNSLILGSFFH
jgi:hypothetical protein